MRKEQILKTAQMTTTTGQGSIFQHVTALMENRMLRMGCYKYEN